MHRSSARYDMSDLEREIELEMDDELASDTELEGLDDEFETDDAEFEADDAEFEADDSEFEVDDGVGTFAQRLSELAQREYESEAELDGALSQVLGEMEGELFFGMGKLVRRIKKSPLGRAMGGRLGKFLKRRLGNIPGLNALGGLKGLTQLARGNLRGALGNLAKAALPAVMSAFPGGAVALPALKALGFEANVEPEENREAWENFVEVAREAYVQLAENLTEQIDQPMEASRVAAAAFQQGLKAVQGGGGQLGARRPAGQVRTIHLRRGDRLRIIVD